MKDSGNQKAFKGVLKQKNKKCFKALQKETKPVKNDTRYKTLLETLKKKLKSYYLNLTDKYKNYNNLGC